MAAIEPLRIVLEFARASDAGDPHAFRFAPQSYLVRGPRGEFTSTEVAWSRELLEDLEALRLPGRDPAALQRVGEVLRRILEPAGWREHEGAIVDAVAEGRRVSVTVRSAAAELYALPWELLTLRSTGQNLGSVSGVLLRYEWPATTSARPQARPPAAEGRVLVAWSAAGGAVPAAEHVAGLASALTAAGRDLDRERDVLGHASFGRLSDALAAAEREGRPIDVLHLLCHGAASGSTFGLVFDGEESGDRPVVVDPGRLQILLAPHAGMIRMVVLAACDSGNMGSLGNRLGSVAQMLHRVGIAAVVASRYPLSVDGSVRMTEALYRQLIGESATLEEAFVRTRSALARDPTTLDWASLQLYARAEDGDATRPLGAPPPGEVPAPVEVVAPPSGRSVVWKVAALVAVLGVTIAVAFALGDGSRGGGVEGAEAVASAAEKGASDAMMREGPEVAAVTTSGAGGAAGASAGGPAPTGPEAAGSTGSGATGEATTKEPARSPSDAGASDGDASGSGSGSASSVTKKSGTHHTTKPSTSAGEEAAPTRDCPASVRDHVETKIGAPPGGGVFTVKFEVASSGAVKLSSCRGCGALEADARSSLAALDRGVVARKLGEGGGCKGSIKWQ